MTMGERIRALSAPVDHGCVFLRDAESKETHGYWNPESSRVSASGDSLLFSVQPSVDGEVEFEIWRGEPKEPLARVLYDGSITLAHGRIVMHDPNDDFRIEIPGLSHGGPVSVLVDDEDFPKKVQVVLLF
jgi:hypothetical protein